MSFFPITVKTVIKESVESNPNTSRNFLRSADGASNIPIDFTAKMAPEGDFVKAIGLNVIINSLKNCLQTPLGTYPFDPTYGSLLFQKIFLPSDQKTVNEIQYEAVNRIAQFDDRVRVIEIKTEFYNNKKGYRLSLLLDRYNMNQTITIDFSDELYTSSNPTLG
jgi:phage baseplate assembly protein W